MSLVGDNAVPLESDGQAIVRVRRSGGADGAISVAYQAIGDSNATVDEDFTATSGTLQWADGDASEREIVVEVIQDDGPPEIVESFTVSLENAQGGAGLGTRLATVDIQPMARQLANSRSKWPTWVGERAASYKSSSCAITTSAAEFV